MAAAPAFGPAPDLLQPAVKAPTAAAGAGAAKIHASAQAFEATFLTTMLGAMFEGVQTSAPFGGGEGEATFRSFLNEAMAKAIVRHGGVGVSAAVERELIRLQSGAHR